MVCTSQTQIINYVKHINNVYKEQGLSDPIIDVLCDSWRDSTKLQYSVYLRKWQKFCLDKNIMFISPCLNDVLCFLLDLSNAGLAYSSINSACSALSSLVKIDGCNVGKHPTVIRFMKGIFNRKPSLPRYDCTWDVNMMLNFLKSLPVCSKISLKLLTYKLCMLLLLLSGQRTQSIHMLNLNNMQLSDSHLKFQIPKLIKTSKPGRHCGEVNFKAFAPDRRLCIVTVAKEYIKRTQSLRDKSGQLLISFNRPYKSVAKCTISNWIKKVMTLAGIDCSVFKPHSVRSAASSKAALVNVPVETILKAACWSNSKTFATYYDKPIVKNFGDELLNRFVQPNVNVLSNA